METLILEALKEPNKLAELLSDKTDEEVAEFNKSLTEYVNNKIESEYLTDYAVTAVKGETTSIEAENLEQFREAQDAITNFYGEMNEEQFKIAVVSYLENEGKFNGIEVPDTLVTFGEMFCLAESNSLVNETVCTDKVRDSIEAESFCGENKTFPTNTKSFAIASLKLVKEYTGDDKDEVTNKVVESAKKFGVGPSMSDESVVTLYPIVVEQESNLYTPIIICNKEDLEVLRENAPSIKDTYNLTEEQVVEFDNFLKEAETILSSTAPLLTNEDCSVTPIKLPQSFFVDYFVKRESSDIRKYLIPLVGIIRQNKITKDVVEGMSKAYNLFGTGTLEKWFESVPEKVETETESEVEKERVITQIPTLPAVNESESHDEKTPNLDKKSDVYSKMCRKRSTRSK